MTAKQVRRIALALVVAVFLWGLSEMIGGRSDEIEELEVLPSLTAAEVDTFVLARTDDTVRLARSPEGEWTVNGYPASASAVEGLFQAMAEPAGAGLVARSGSSHERMGVDAASAGRLRIVRGDQTDVDLLIGNQGRPFQSVYVRPEGDDRVYLLKGGIALQLDRSVTDWRDKGIVRLMPGDIARVEVERGSASYALARDGEGWTLDGAAADNAAVEDLLRLYRNVEAQGRAFATPAEADSADFSQPDARLTVLGADGNRLAALVFDSAAAGYWVRHARGGTVYQMYGWKVDEILPIDTTLRAR
jgi:hypothetical protein